jgi:hypothetical protein
LNIGVIESPYRWYAESATFRLNDTGSRWLTVSLVRGVDDSPYHRYGEFSLKKFNSRLSVSVMRGVADSAYQWCGELATPRISDAGSRQLPVSVIVGVVFWIRISPRIRSQNRNGPKGSVRDSWGTISAKIPENPPHCHVPLRCTNHENSSDLISHTCAL